MLQKIAFAGNEYENMRTVLSALFHVAILMDSERTKVPSFTPATAAAVAIRHAEEHIEQLGIVDPDKSR